jgi:CDP-2,3-bis-(O-geranylgeranyl)-sn-glycerol synthase
LTLQALYTVFVYPIVYILPAYVANASPVLFGKGSRPLDFGMKMNGKRILGSNKTIRGTVLGIASGIVVGAVEYPLFHALDKVPFFSLLAIAVLLSAGALAGDILGSFIKRRTGMESGKNFPLLDQYGFFVVALLLASPLGYMPDAYGLLFLVVLTGVLHVLTNMGAYKLGIKKVPW